MTEEQEPDHHDGLWIPESQKHRGFKNLNIDTFLNRLHHCGGEKCQHSGKPGSENSVEEDTN